MPLTQRNKEFAMGHNSAGDNARRKRDGTGVTKSPNSRIQTGGSGKRVGILDFGLCQNSFQ